MKISRYLAIIAFVLCCYCNRANAIRLVINTPIKNDIYQAAVDNKPQKIDRYLRLGYSIDSLDGEFMSALCSAKENGETDAYNLLLKFGASPNLECMTKATELRRRAIIAKVKKYGAGALLTIGGIGGAIALANGGGSGGGSGGSSGGNSGGSSTAKTPGGNMNLGKNPISLGEVETYFTEEEFKNSSEYYGGNFGATPNEETAETAKGGFVINSVNYMGGINAAEAYSKFVGLNSEGNLSANLTETIVGVIDTGVYAKHNEFKTATGTKVFGHNFDYGPCSDGDNSNCWKPAKEPECISVYCVQEIVLVDGEGRTKETTTMDCLGGEDGCSPFEEWKKSANYPANYDRDKLIDDVTPLAGDDDNLHGSNVAGIIGANLDNAGNLGVAFANAKIDAVRWDFMSSLYEPLKSVLADGASVVNLSIGANGTGDKSNASLINEQVNIIDGLGYLEAMQDIIHSYNRTDSGAIDGMIVVKAAGNDAYSQPDILSGVKLLNKEIENSGGAPVNSYADLQMLVVVAVDVTIGSDGTVDSYGISSFSNKCGVTANYCIAAPGGSQPTGTSANLLYSTAEAPDRYIEMMGTSQASPVVTGSIAFVKGAFPYMAASEIIELLRVTANTNGEGFAESAKATHNDEVYGAGLLDLGKAVTTYISENGTDVSTVEGNSVNSKKVVLNGAHLTVTSTFKNALEKALPETIAAFDKYNRPFAFNTANYVSVTHGDYKAFKNDVYNIARRGRVNKTETDGLILSFANGVQNSGFGFVSAEYNTDKQTRGFWFSENTAYDADRYFASSLKNPFMSFNDAYGVYNTFNLNENLGLKVEAVSGRNGLYDGDRAFQDTTFKKQAYAVNAELQLHKGKKFSMGISSGMLYEDEALLGMNGEGAFDINSSNTYNTGVNVAWFATPKLTFSGSYYLGFTREQNFASNLLKTSDLVSEGFAIDANYKYSKDLDFGLQVSSPLRVRNGTLAVNFASGRDNQSNEVYREQYKASLVPEAREYKFATYVNKDVSDKLSIRSEFDVRVNPEHQNTSNDYRALLGLSWTFN